MGEMASIIKRNNRFYVVYKYNNEKGERKQKWESYKTMTEARTRQKEVEYRESIGTFVVPQCHTLKELLKEYVALYGKQTWALSTYAANIGVIKNYILPFIGDLKLQEITPRVLEKYYQQLLKTKPVPKANGARAQSEFVTPATIRDVHKLLRNCFGQAVKWELIEKNPALNATVPKYKAEKREIWTAETLFHAIEICEEPRLKLSLNLTFACSLRIGELLALTWDCVDISEDSVENGFASITVNKELQRVTRDAISTLDGKDIVMVFPSENLRTQTVQVLKSPKTQSSVRKIFLPKSVAKMLIDWKRQQEEAMDYLGEDYHDYNLVIAGPNGNPTEGARIRDDFNRLIAEHDLPRVVFHSLRHSSITYKLKLNGGDVKAVQGDSGHAQTSMVTDVYSHILDDDRRHNAELFEEAFYSGNGVDPGAMNAKNRETEIKKASDVDTLMRLLGNPETAGLLKQLVKAMDN